MIESEVVFHLRPVEPAGTRANAACCIPITSTPIRFVNSLQPRIPLEHIETRDIVFDDEAITGRRGHCLVWAQEGHPLVMDLGSDNGTWLTYPGEFNPTPLEPGKPASLVEGSLIQVGNKKFQMEKASQMETR